jgi:hypothetical protein
MWSLFNLTFGFKFYFGKRCLEKDPKGSAPSRVEITRIEKFRDLSVLYQELSSELEQGREFRIEIFDGKETIEINSRDIDFIKRKTNRKNILVEIELKYNDQIVNITNASAVSIVYVEAKPTKPRLDANAGEVQYAPGTIGFRLQKIFPNINTLKIELMKPGALESNSSAVLVIVERDTLANSTIEPEKFFQIKIEDKYQGTNLPNVWVLPMSAVNQITVVGQNFIRVEWVDGNPPDSRKMVFPLSEYRFFVIKEQSTTARPDQGREPTAAAKPGSAEALAESAKPGIVTLRDVVLSYGSLTNLPDSEIKITNLCENPECNLKSLMESWMKYYLVIVEGSLMGLKGSSSVLDLPLNFSTGKISQRCNVVPLYNITGVKVSYSNNAPFGINVSWCESGSQNVLTMVYPIRDYHFYLIGIPNSDIGIPNSDNDVLAQLLQNPPGTPAVVEQLESAIKVAFGKK